MSAGGLTRRTTGYNFLNCLSDRCAAAGVLAGFSITVATLVATVASTSDVIFGPIRFRDVAGGLIGLSAVLFLVSLEYFLSAKENNPWDVNLTQEYLQAVQQKTGEFAARWAKMPQDSTLAEGNGRRAYNIAILALFVGMFFAFYPFSPGAAVTIAGVGIGSQVYQAWPNGSEKRKAGEPPKAERA